MNTERTESEQRKNEDLVALIQDGHRELLSQLWGQVERFIAMQARKRVRVLAGIGGVTEEDLYQSGFLALVAAVDSYDSEVGCGFIGWLDLHLKTSFAEAGGYRSEKQKRDPLHVCTSLDLPLGDSEGGETRGDIQVDPGSAAGFEEAENRIWRVQLCAVLNRALERLPEAERSTLRRRYFQAHTLDAIASADGVSKERVRQREHKGLRMLRRPGISRELRQFVEERTSYYSCVGLSSFEHTGSSQPERLVILREQWSGGSPLVKT